MKALPPLSPEAAAEVRFRLTASYFLYKQKVTKELFRGEVPESLFVFAEKSAIILVRPADAPLG